MDHRRGEHGLRLGTERVGGRVIDDTSLLDGFAVDHDGRPIGCALVNLVDGDAELVVLVTTYRGAGAGTALLEAVVDQAKRESGRASGS